MAGFQSYSRTRLSGRRPAFVLSPAPYNARRGLILCCPIASKVKPYPFVVPILGDSKVAGAVERELHTWLGAATIVKVVSILARSEERELPRVGAPMRPPQTTFAEAGFEAYYKPTRRERFLTDMDQVVPWPALCALIKPVYPKNDGAGRPTVGLERMLRGYFLQQWFNLSDPAVEEALYERAPDETTARQFRHLLEQHSLGEQIFRLFVTCALANLFMVRRRLLRLAGT